MKKKVKATKQTKAKKKSVKSAPKIKIPDCCPYRSESSYAVIWTILYNNRKKGISREQLQKQVKKLLKSKTSGQVYFSCSVIISPSKNGKAHRSANTGANFYYCEKQAGGHIKLVMRKA